MLYIITMMLGGESTYKVIDQHASHTQDILVPLKHEALINHYVLPDETVICCWYSYYEYTAAGYGSGHA